jgi:hypothetical protein
MGEIIPIPSDRADERRPINLEFTPRAFPGQRFACRLDYNGASERWIVEFEHVSRDYRITKGVASPGRPYEYLPYLVFLFMDPSGEAKEITPSNLGEDVQLFVLPGESGKAPEDES